MSKIKGLFQKAWTVVTNPGQEDRVQIVLQAIQRGFREQKQAFDLNKILEPILCFYGHAVHDAVTKTSFSQWDPATFTVGGVLYPTVGAVSISAEPRQHCMLLSQCLGS